MVNSFLKWNSARGITLFELLIATLMIAMVFVAATSVYVSAAKFLSGMIADSQALAPGINIEEIAKKASQANEYAVGNLGKSLDLRGDYSDTGWNAPINTPSNFADDAWAHYRICGGAGGDLRVVYDAVSSTNVNCGNDPILINNVDGAASSFTAMNPSAQGTATVIKIHLKAGSPQSDLETGAMLGAKSKN